MEEIKQEWRKRKTYWDTFGNLATKEIEDFWLEKIDLAVSKERERVTSKTDEVWDLLCQMDTNIKSEKEYAKDIINLINTK